MKDISHSSSTKFSSAAIWGGSFALLLILGAIALSADHLLAFFSLGGFMIVGGGVIAVAFMSFNAADVHAALGAIRNMFREPRASHGNMHNDVKDILYSARIIKEKGMRGLEQDIKKVAGSDPFIRYGLTMVISDYTPDEIRSMMETAADAYYERDIVPVQVLQAMANHAPAFGMIGTLIGMVTMLYKLGDNPSAIGPALAVAFLSTLYGVISARMLYMPAAAKLTQKLDSLRFRNHLLTEGMVLLAAGKPQVYIHDKLNSFLRPEMHDAVDAALANRGVTPMKAVKP